VRVQRGDRGRGNGGGGGEGVEGKKIEGAFAGDPNRRAVAAVENRNVARRNAG